MTSGTEASIQDLAEELYELKTAVKSLTEALTAQPASPPAPDWEWMNSEQLTLWLGLDDVRALYHLRSSGQAPRAHKIGKELKFRRRDIEAWLLTRAEA